MQATITMDKHVPVEKLQDALKAAGDYTIEVMEHEDHGHEGSHPHKFENQTHVHQPTPTRQVHTSRSIAGGEGKYYCPMHCEGEKLYDKPGNCPVCGMNLEKVPE